MGLDSISQFQNWKGAKFYYRTDPERFDFEITENLEELD